MQDLLELVTYLQGYVNAIELGILRFTEVAPITIRQQISRLAARRLQSTRETYMDAVRTTQRGTLFLVELDPDNWIANAVESGIGQFNMKETHLTSPKARVSKSGYRYLKIPIGVKKDKRPADNDSAKAFQNKINEVLGQKKQMLGRKTLKATPGGQVIETQKILVEDPMFRGIYRSRQYENAADYHKRQGTRRDWNYVMFRTMSENPESRSRWIHPGIKPVNIFGETSRWAEANLDHLLDQLIQSEVEAFEQSSKLGL